jgi:hypothetical protein
MIDSARSRFLLAFVLAAPMAACGGGSSGSEGPAFSEVYSTIISGRCLPCHSSGGGFMYGKLDMSSEQAAYSNLVGVKAAGTSCIMSNLTRIVPGSATTSLMFNKVNAKLKQIAPPCGDTMPDDQTVLDQTQVDLIETWINDGAQK